jgi:hypothetical protein
MADANTYLKVTELDFDGIRNNLKTYLSTRNEFKDFNFEGSTIGTLIDVLAYNTHYNSYYTNMVANEMFLDTAQQRDSVVSRARELGYLPNSSRGSKATVSLSFNGVASTETRITVLKNSTFSSVIDNVNYTFVLPEDLVIDSLNGQFTADTLIKEGTPLTHRVTYSSVDKTKIIIPNKNVDTDSISIKVQNSSVDLTSTDFKVASNISEIKSTTPIYFVEEASDGKYEIVFGSGSLGKELKNDNIVIIDYLVNNSSAANGAKSFSPIQVSTDKSYTSVSVTTVDAATGGREVESVESIKFNAPRNYQTQNRAVVAEDFKRILLNEQSDLDSVIAFGGENFDPPTPGKVYIAVKPINELFTTVQRKSQIKDSISSRCMLSIEPVIIDPDFTYIILDIKTYYNQNETSLKSGDIKKLVLDEITSFSTTNLERFENRLRFSKLLRALDNIDNSIINNESSIKIQKRFTPNTQRPQRITLKYNNSLTAGTIESSEFTYNGSSSYFDDDGLGNIRIFRYSDSVRVDVIKNAGKVDYETGILTVENFKPSAYSGIEVKVDGKPKNLDVKPVREQILILSSEDAKVTIIGEN